MKRTYNLSELKWNLSGYTPYLWRFIKTMELGVAPNAEVRCIPAKVPGSVQASLLEAGIIADWNVGFNSRECEPKNPSRTWKPIGNSSSSGTRRR